MYVRSLYSWRVISDTNEVHLITIPEQVFQTLNASNYSASFPKDVATGRLGMFDTLHLLHCVVSTTGFADFDTES